MKKTKSSPPKAQVLAPAILCLFKDRHVVKDFKRNVDKRPLSALEEQVTDAFKQILTRAHGGDNDALGTYFILTQRAVMSFDNLVRHEGKRLQAIAELSPNLPVLLSLNPQDIEAAKARVKLLNVGAKAIVPTRTGQRTDRRNHWTTLALGAFDACRKNVERIPRLTEYFAGAKQQSVSRKLWETTLLGVQYTLPNDEQIVIADWQAQCPKLALQVTSENYSRWRDVIKSCVLEFWHRSKDDYHAALKNIGNAAEVESYRRHLAMNRVLQAFKSQFYPR